MNFRFHDNHLQYFTFYITQPLYQRLLRELVLL